MNQVVVLKHVAHENLGTIDRALRFSGLEIRNVRLFDDSQSELDMTRYCGLILLGGPMNVDQTDRYPFLHQEVHWIRDALSANVPVLGICLGAQLLAKSLGSSIYPNGVKEIGWYEIKPTVAARDDRLLRVLAEEPTVFQWHGDTFDLPDGAVCLASSAACPNQAFRYGDSAYGLQFHLEVTLEMINAWLDVPENREELADLDQIDAALIRQQSPNHLSALHEMAQVVFGEFARLCCAKASNR